MPKMSLWPQGVAHEGLLVLKYRRLRTLTKVTLKASESTAKSISPNRRINLRQLNPQYPLILEREPRSSLQCPVHEALKTNPGFDRRAQPRNLERLQCTQSIPQFLLPHHLERRRLDHHLSDIPVTGHSVLWEAQCGFSRGHPLLGNTFPYTT